MFGNQLEVARFTSVSRRGEEEGGSGRKHLLKDDRKRAK